MRSTVSVACVAVSTLAVIGSTVAAFSASSSSFLGVNNNDRIPAAISVRPNKRSSTTPIRTSAAITMYNDPPKGSHPEQNAWSVIATTERWISDTLKTNNQIASASSGGSNPYARKEVSYYCETSRETSMIVAGIFRMLKEARERGESHGTNEDERLKQIGQRDYEPKTMRQTQVIVIPGSSHFASSFSAFDTLVANINQARREARDYITDAMLEKIDSALSADDDDEDGIGNDWSVAINLAHLHPKFGEKTPAQTIQEMKDEESSGNGEVDVNLEEYKRARLLARRSPYPTVVLEVRATPPPDFGQSPQTPSFSGSSASSSSSYIGKGEEKITAADIQRLEALFGKSAITDKSASSDDMFWNSIGNTIQEVSALTPIKMAQRWMTSYDPSLVGSSENDDATVSFTETSTMYVDAAYEFVFTNIAMMTQDDGASTASTASSTASSRYYLVMPNFLSSAATSFEKFAAQLNNLVSSLPDLSGTIEITTFHPEHINPDKRPPVPILSLQWKK